MPWIYYKTDGGQQKIQIKYISYLLDIKSIEMPNERAKNTKEEVKENHSLSEMNWVQKKACIQLSVKCE